jgi:hypothetical protein
LLPDGAYCPSCTQGNIRKRLAESKLATPAAAPVSAAPPPEAAPALDPLRGVQNFHDLEEKQPKEAKALRAQLLGQIMQSLPKMDTARVQEVAQFMDLCNNDRGCVTPVESFITDLVSDHYLYGGLTPEGVMAEFEGQDGFKVNYEECAEGVDRFNLAYGQPAQAHAVAVPGAVPITTQAQELRARLMEQLAGMSACKLESITQYADIREAHNGCDTPAEEFIALLVLHHAARPITPDDVGRRLEEFRENFDSMVEGARNFSAKYPKAASAA